MIWPSDRQGGMETLLVKRNRARTVAGLAAVLLVGLAVAGCGHRGATASPTVAAVTPAPAATAGDNGTPGSAVASTAAATPSASPSAPSSVAPPTATAPAGPATPDPVASELDQINQLINDINNSVQSSDSSQQGGE